MFRLPRFRGNRCTPCQNPEEEFLIPKSPQKKKFIIRCPDDHCAGRNLTCGPQRNDEGEICLNKYGHPYCWQCQKPTIKVEIPSYLEGFENDSTFYSSYESFKKYMDEYLNSLQN